jgi:hypothetical protein
MKTVDFLPASAFEAFLERRRTPRRATIVGGYLLACLTAAGALKWEAHAQEKAAIAAEAPNAEETRAGEELRAMYAEMNSFGSELDPLSAHLRLPAAGQMLANLASAAGDHVRIEEIGLEHSVARKGDKIEHAELRINVTALVHGDKNLIELPERLRAHTGMKEADTASSELVLNIRDTMRTEIEMSGSLVLPGMAEAKPKEAPKQ